MKCDANGMCIPRGCEEDGGSVCGDDQVCDPTYRYASSHCVALKCNDGFECQPWQACGTSGGDHHGCYPLACQNDEDCGGCGYCVNAQCSPMLGECHEEYLALPYGCVWPDEEWV
jgi:hypothetical protein